MSVVETNSPFTTHRADVRLGLLYGLSANLAWGISPLYFKLLAGVRPAIILCHRIVWSVLLLAILVAATRQLRPLLTVLRSRRAVIMLLLSTLLVSSNWYTFIYSIDQNRILEASLGYFICPLLSVLLGVVLLRERLRPTQTAALLLASIAVANLVFRGHSIPWLALTLAITFSLYGLVRKTVAAPPLIGLMIETTLLFPIAMILLLRAGDQAVPQPIHWLLLPAAGLVTAVPLLLFTSSTKRLRLATIGFLQYTVPTSEFLLAIFRFNEKLHPERLLSFILIWIALAIYTFDSLRAQRPLQPPSDTPA